MKLKHIIFLAAITMSSTGVMLIYTTLAVALAVTGVAVPFATGRFIDSLAYETSPYTPFMTLAALLVTKTFMSPILQRMISAQSRKIEIDLQMRVLDATMNLPQHLLEESHNGEIVAKLTRDTYAIGSFVRDLYPRLIQAIVIVFAAGCALFNRSIPLAIAFMVFFPLAILAFAPFARRFSTNSHRVRLSSDKVSLREVHAHNAPRRLPRGGRF